MTKTQGEVITSVQCRRRWSGLKKGQIVAVALEPGAVVSRTRAPARPRRRNVAGDCVKIRTSKLL